MCAMAMGGIQAWLEENTKICDVPDIKDDGSDIKENSLGIKENIPDIKENSSGIKENIPDIKENISSSKEENSDIKENISSTKEANWDIKENISSTKEASCNIKENISSTKEDSPDIKDISNIKQESMGEGEIDDEDKEFVPIGLLAFESTLTEGSALHVQGMYEDYNLSYIGLIDGDRVYKCNECDYTAKMPYLVKKHIDAKHKKIRHKCPQCDYTVVRKTHLRRHIESAHLGLRFPCEHCEYVANSKKLP